MRTFLTALLLLALTLACAPQPADAADGPLVIAHRGTRGSCPWTENTVRSFRRCAAKADALETDMRLSSTRRPVFIHDATLDRTTKASGRVDRRTFKQLRNVVTEDGVGRIPSAATIGNHIARTGQTVFIDVKVWPTSKGWRILRKQLGAHRDKVVLFSAKDNRYVKRAREFGFQSAHYSWPSQPAPTLTEARRYGIVWRKTWTAAQATRFRDAGIRMVWGSNDPAVWDLAASRGASWVNTDRLHRYLSWRG